MTAIGSSLDAAPQPGRAAAWELNPFLHVDDGRIYNPLTDRTLAPGDAGHAALLALATGGAALAELPAAARDELGRAGWLVPPESSPETAFRLKYVSLEAHTVCNQGCYFCPVSLDPREAYFMPTEQYESILDQLVRWRDTIEAVFMINYNEPTADKRFVDQVRAIKERGLPPATLTNGTGLTPKRVDELVAMGGLRFLSINLSTLDRDRYAADRRGDHLDLVLRNLDHAKDLPVAEDMDMVVLGKGDDVHRADYQAIRQRFAGSRFNVKYFEVMDRAGYLQIGLSARNKTLCGCDNVGPRPLQHIHVTPRGKCVLCCEDYDERYVVGDLTTQTVEEVLTGPAMATMRRWVYGLDEAPADFICRSCVFARTR
ncbi:MAG TPA: radical SAM/SPASM domain-containing protein [Thermoanaerobaculia bacterium]|nr:radical SAM/SPASM domain-containing protein [Thermoanaerobaculia bacterium]